MKHSRYLLHLQRGIKQQMLGLGHLQPVDIFMQWIPAAPPHGAPECRHGEVQALSHLRQIGLLIDTGIQRLPDQRHGFLLPRAAAALELQ